VKVFFDTNIYVGEFYFTSKAEELISRTLRARWRILVSSYVLAEFERVGCAYLKLARREVAVDLTTIVQRSTLVPEVQSRHVVPGDPNDSPILRAALAAGADYLVTRDKLLLTLEKVETLLLVDLLQYEQIMESYGHHKR
jgi:putative PIN family toxin of toxin-antitoxin system